MFFRKRNKTENIGIREGYDQWAAGYPTEQNPIKSASEITIKKMLPDLKGKTLVDAGCGSGYFCQYAEHGGAKEVIGIDFSAKMIEQAKKICLYTKFVVNDIENAELEESSADVIVSSLVLGHIKKIEPVIVKFSRMLRRDGILIITDFHPFLSLSGQKRTFRLDKKLYEIPHYVHMLNEHVNLLVQSGLSIEKMEEPDWQGNPVIFALKAKKI